MSMEINISRRIVSLGFTLAIYNRTYGAHWSGHLDSVCKQIQSESLAVDVASRPPEATRLIHPTRASLSTVLGAKAMRAVIQERNSGVMRSVLTCEQSIDRTGESGVTYDPLEKMAIVWMMALTDSVETLDLVCKTFPDMISAVDVFGMTVPLWACALGRSEVFARCLLMGLDITIVNKFCWNAADLASNNGHAPLALSAMKAGALAPGESLVRAFGRAGLAKV